jgi:tight adherence protein B
MTPLLELAAGGVACAFVAIAAFALAQATSPDSGLRKLLALYVAGLARSLRALFVFTDPRAVVLGQLAAIYGVLALAIWARSAPLALLAGPLAAAPVVALHVAAARRRRSAEEQVPAFVLALANALRSTPSVGDALRTVAPVIAEPLRSETVLALKETRLGRTSAEALEQMAKRVQSRALDTAVAAVVLGQQTGGNLPKTLESLAAALRELQRLDANLRAKTAGLRVQVWIVALAPVAFVAVLEKMQPHYFDAMLASTPGRVAAAIALVSWLAAIALARQILAVRL